MLHAGRHSLAVSRRLTAALVLAGVLSAWPAGAKNVNLAPADTVPGYVARLLINEAPFPGERGWKSESDTKAAMLAILYVLDARLNKIPKGYKQQELAATQARNIIEVITVGGEKGQCDGFYKNSKGDFVAVKRVHDRIDYLSNIAGKGEPGKFARLLNYGQELASAYVRGGVQEADRFAKLTNVQGKPVTGSAYSWMTDKDIYHPGGSFVKIPNSQSGSLGGNRFYTLKDRTK